MESASGIVKLTAGSAAGGNLNYSPPNPLKGELVLWLATCPPSLPEEGETLFQSYSLRVLLVASNEP